METTTRQTFDRVIVESDHYRLELPDGRPYLLVFDRQGALWAELCLCASVHRLGALDETISLSGPTRRSDLKELTLEITADSSAWQARRLLIRCGQAEIGLRVEVVGSGRLTDVHLGGGYYAGTPARGTGFLRSGAGFASVFNPEPGPLDRFAAPASHAAAIDVVGGSWPGRGHWFFTPAPFCYGWSRAQARAGIMPDGPWLMAGLAVRPGEHRFMGFHYDVEEEAFAFRLDYQGQTQIDEGWTSPELRILFGPSDPYQGLAAYRRSLERDGLVEPPPTRSRPDARPAWWQRPMFCGWGAQVALVEAERRARDQSQPGRTGHPDEATETRIAAVAAPDRASQVNYDLFLAQLAEHGLRPGTIVIDDKWQTTYGTNEPDTAKWPDLRGWIRSHHADDQRVLLWWKAWDPEGLPAEYCVTRPDGAIVAVDPGSSAYQALLRETMLRLLGPDGLNADGFKIDFTAQTPSGPSLRHHGEAWGVELLLELLRGIHEAVKRVRPDALVITHCPNPAFAGYSDMIRLNDALRLTDARPWPPVVPQMLHRAAIVRAATPDLLIDTDNWAMPDLATFRKYLAAQVAVGVAALYYATEIDTTGERFEEADYATIRDVWERTSRLSYTSS